MIGVTGGVSGAGGAGRLVPVELRWVAPKGFSLYWHWKSRSGRCGRPCFSNETRELIPKMSRANPLWAAPRIHGELLKLGIQIANDGGEVYGISTPTAFTELAHIPREPRSPDSGNRLSGSKDRELSLVICIRGGSPSPASRHSLQRDGATDCRMDGPANRRSVSVG